MKRYVFALLLAAIMLAGCISLEVEQKVNRDGSSVVTQRIDLSGFISMAESQGAFEDSDALENMTNEMNDYCTEVESQSDADCTYSESSYVLVVTKTVTPDEAGYEFEKSYEFPNVVYTLKAEQLPDMGLDDLSLGEDGSSLGGGTPARFDDPEMKQSIASIKMMGVEMEYTIEMPGQITEAKNGEIDDDGRAVYDVVELIEDGKNVEVTSSEADPVGSLCGGTSFALASVLLLAAFARFRG